VTRPRPLDPDWAWVFLALSLFLLVALVDLPAALRKVVLSTGTAALFVVIAAKLVANLRANAALLALVLFALGFWVLAFPPALNGNDDNTAYLIFAKDFYGDFPALVQPLSERRLFSMGGLYALQGTVLQWLGPRYLGLVEPALGLALILLIASERVARDRAGIVLSAVVVLTPLGGSRVLTNLSSAFVLCGYTLAILALARRAILQGPPTRLQIVLFISLPAIAATIRPTTFPFNAAISCAALTVLAKRRQLRADAIGVALVLVATLAVAAVPYHRAFGTFLFPLLGRGSHFSAEGYSIAGSLTIAEHLSNLGRTIARDPLFVLVAVLFVLLARVEKGRAGRRLLAFVAAVYVLVYVSIVAATGGVAPARYSFPVSLALLVMQADWFAEASPSGRPRRIVAFGIPTAVILTLAASRAFLGVPVVQQRLKTFAPPPEVLSVIPSVVADADASGGTVILESQYNRFLAERLHRRYWILDQPGMLSPWRLASSAVPYQDGFPSFLELHQVRTIVLDRLDCARAPGSAPSGWGGMQFLALRRHTDALCALRGRFREMRIDGFTLLRRTGDEGGRTR
jgi:hypothetical protein